MRLASQGAHARVAVQEGLGGEAPERDDDARGQQLDLPQQKRGAAGDLERLRIAVARRPALEHVGDIDLPPAFQIQGPQHVVEEAAGLADERLAALVFLGSRGLTDEQPDGALRPHAKDRLFALRPERTGPAGGDGSLQSVHVELRDVRGAPGRIGERFGI